MLSLFPSIANNYYFIYYYSDARRTEEGSGQEYLCKWKGLPYSECTWEDGELLTDLYQQEIDNYMYRNESDCIPCRSAKVSIAY